MEGYNAIVVFDTEAERILMCKRRKDPYKGLINFVGGKIEEQEAGIDAAYRELEEETSITREDIHLTHLMDFSYSLDQSYMEVYVGRLCHSVEISGDENELFWSSLEHDFFDITKYAGEGDIGHILLHIEMHRQELLGQTEKML